MRSNEHPFQYAILRVVPDEERGERLNVGVVMLARSLDYLGFRAEVTPEKLASIAPKLSHADVETQLDSLRRIAAGNPKAGLMARLPLHERFHWLTAPSNTVIQPSELHTGLCTDPGVTLGALFSRLVD